MSPAVVALSTAGFWSTRTDEVTGSKPVRASAGGIFIFLQFLKSLISSHKRILFHGSRLGSLAQA